MPNLSMKAQDEQMYFLIDNSSYASIGLNHSSFFVHSGKPLEIMRRDNENTVDVIKSNNTKITAPNVQPPGQPRKGCFCLFSFHDFCGGCGKKKRSVLRHQLLTNLRFPVEFQRDQRKSPAGKIREFQRDRLAILPEFDVRPDHPETIVARGTAIAVDELYSDGDDAMTLAEALELMDPEGRRLPTFSIVNSYHNDLAPLRAEKAKLEKAIRMTQEEKRAPLMEKRRVLAVEEDKLELEVRRMLTGKLMAYKDAFLANMDALGRLDLIVAKAKLALRYHCVRPVLSNDKSITLRGVRHPQVEEDLAQRGEGFTLLDLDLKPGCTVITGANMGGKTVSLRSTVLSLLLCQCGFFVFAQSARLPLFHRVELILADSGPGAGGLSSFGKEVHLLDNLLRGTKDQFFFVALDEFARGTNPQEGAALARALVRHLGSLDCVALMTTHYDGVSDVAGAHYQVAGLVRDIKGDEGDDPRKRIARRMDYRLLPAPPGAPCPRDALRVCRLLKLDDTLMELFQADL